MGFVPPHGTHWLFSQHLSTQAVSVWTLEVGMDEAGGVPPTVPSLSHTNTLRRPRRRS